MVYDKKLKIGVHDFKPVVFQKDGKWTGFEIEVWEKIAQTLNLQYEFVEDKSFPDLLTKTSEGEYDLAIAGITRTLERTKKLDMSFFTLDTGLGIATIPTQSFSAKDLFRGLFSKQTAILLFILILFSLISANIYWFIESGLSVSAKYSQGVFESLWWSIVTFSTIGYGDVIPASFGGKVFGMFSILSGLAIFGLYIGQLSSSLTLTKMKSKISSAGDLANKKIGVKKGTTAKDVVKAKHGHVIEFESLSEAYDALESQSIDAVVADLPVLQDQMRERDFVLVGGAFARQTYAFASPRKKDNEELLEQIDQAIIGLQESGEYENIYEAYFTN
ncbi:hypothetical protein A2442_02015 [Candidatus Campbellbacteria bacterium RIFOXYC2_FULL_35_25]|uniref:Solute-binding protein family 3/N-terminal domain-containing protein n=1 Tax=Candidatus Campbellbacteria bacterium RIFOXYC2_FULL_35_25 TaxID=1797582 RepID=A0A1F5EID8_9BACT|nr:MAG: hypothetical protein A2442_02015 [Candidatus Campbellbacteria bacterium RIFOXYC2_FULL_35_25]